MVLEKARTVMLKTGCRGIIFAIETGAHHWRNLAYFLDEKGIPFHLINQYTLKRRREGKDLNHRKNDYRDSEVAAELRCTGEFTATRLPHGIYAELLAAYSSYRRLVKMRTRIMNLTKSLLDGYFPSSLRFSKILVVRHQRLCLCICAGPREIAGMTESKFEDVVKTACQGRVMKRKLQVLYRVAGTSIGIEEGVESVSSEISFLIENIRLIVQRLLLINTGEACASDILGQISALYNRTKLRLRCWNSV